MGQKTDELKIKGLRLLGKFSSKYHKKYERANLVWIMKYGTLGAGAPKGFRKHEGAQGILEDPPGTEPEQIPALITDDWLESEDSF